MTNAQYKDINFSEIVKVWRSQNLIDYVLNDLEKNVKRDKATKLTVFFTGLSAYLPEPINLFLKGESGIGKSYVTVQTLKYFPKDDVWFLGGLSPKALIHEKGILLNKYGEQLNLEDKPKKPKKKDYDSEEKYKEALKEYYEELKVYAEEIRNSYTLIDLRNKILVFLESPDFETFHMLYPILSHDTEEIEYKFTDKSEKSMLRTRKVKIKGFPATIFCMTDRKHMEELSTRSFTLTPEASKEKIEQAIELINLKASFPFEYDKETKEFKVIKALIESLKNQLANKTDVIIPFSLEEIFPKEITRDMRDFQHFIQLLKAITILHFYQRPFIKIEDKRFIFSSIKDVEKALEIYSDIFETTRTGTEQRILKFYHEIVKTKEAWYLNEITAKYNELHKEKKLSSNSIFLMLKRLSQIGYVDVQKDSEDKRLNVYKPLVMKEEEKFEIQIFLKNKEDLTSKLKKSFEERLSKYLKESRFYFYKNFSEDRWGETEINVEEAKKLILNEEIFSSNSDKLFFKYPSESNLESKSEKKLENNLFKEFKQFSSNSLLECKYCKAKGVNTCFMSLEDLILHVKACHLNEV